jgi:hypothetical protein
MARELLQDALSKTTLPFEKTIEGVIRARVTNPFEIRIKRHSHFRGIASAKFSIPKVDVDYKSPNVDKQSFTLTE